MKEVAFENVQMSTRWSCTTTVMYQKITPPPTCLPLPRGLPRGLAINSTPHKKLPGRLGRVNSSHNTIVRTEYLAKTPTPLPRLPDQNTEYGHRDIFMARRDPLEG